MTPPRRGDRAPAGAPSARHRQPSRERDAGGRSFSARTSRGTGSSASSTHASRTARTSSRGSGRRRAVARASSRTRTRCSPTRREWDRDPWSGDLVDGEVWGRGALDMKGQVAASAVAFASRQRGGFVPAGDLILLVVADEEVGAEYGLSWLRRGSSGRGALRLRDQRGRRRPARARRHAGLSRAPTAEKMSAPFKVRVHGAERPRVDAGHRRQRARRRRPATSRRSARTSRRVS